MAEGFEEVVCPNGLVYIKSNLLSSSHGFFTRLGGVSSGCYDGLQCSVRTKFDLDENVSENRLRVVNALGLDNSINSLCLPEQCHSCNVFYIEKLDDISSLGACRGDALVSNLDYIAVGVVTADCAPVILEDYEAGIVGAVHAGWRGALNGIIGNAVSIMLRKGGSVDRIKAVIGPCIGPSSYEVGDDFFHAFTSNSKGNKDFFHKSGTGMMHFDLPGYLSRELSNYSITSQHSIGIDTYSDGRFFSNRRSLHNKEKDYGRFLSVICVP